MIVRWVRYGENLPPSCRYCSGWVSVSAAAESDSYDLECHGLNSLNSFAPWLISASFLREPHPLRASRQRRQRAADRRPESTPRPPPLSGHSPTPPARL